MVKNATVRDLFNATTLALSYLKHAQLAILQDKEENVFFYMYVCQKVLLLTNATGNIYILLG